MKINLLFGFLGSGKTTLVRRILAERVQQQSLAVIVNELGDVGIDGAIIEGHDIDVVELTSGCVCCTLKGSLLNAIEELKEVANVQRIVVEATGVAHPKEMLETLSDPALRVTIQLGPLVAVVNTPKFSVLRDGLGEFYTAQIKHADVLLLNKIDLARPEELESVRQEVKAINPKATVLFTEQCDTDVAFILDADERYLRARAAESGHVHGKHHHGNDEHEHTAHPHIDSFVVDAGGDARRALVEQFFAQLPANVWRAKGFMRIEGEPCLVQFATGQLDITPADARGHPRLVFIGKNLNEQEIEARFASARGAGTQDARANLSGGERR